MNPFIEKIIPLILAFVAGILAKQLKLLKKEDAPVFLKLVLSVTLPALTILAVTRVTLSMDLILIPISAMLIVFIIYFISNLIGKSLKLEGPTFGSFLVGTLIMNSAFALPFFAAAHGDEGLARASLFDIGNSFLIFTFIYYQAIKYGDNPHTDRINWGKFLKLPPLWGMVIALLFKAIRVPMPELATNFLSLVGNPTVPLVMISLGLYFEPRLNKLGAAFVAVFIRMGVGLAIGIALALLFNLQGVTRSVVVVCSALPIGFNTLIFANLENMDREFAATEVSISILIALFLIPYLIWLLG